MRQYVAWCVASGKGSATMYLIHLHPELDKWDDQLRKAVQFARRSDARKAIADLELEDARAVEKTFG